MVKPLIKVEGLYKIFGRQPKSVMPLLQAGKSKDEILVQTGHTVGLKDINLTINQGDIFVIMGLSGSGKSTLIRHFNRLIDPTQGIVKVEDVDITSLNYKCLMTFRRHKMSMVFQKFGLMPHRTVLDNVAYGQSIQGVSKVERRANAQQWVDLVGLSGYGKQYPNQLSGGQQQRVGLARALCTNADVLLMDEPFSALDPLIRSEMQEQLIDLQGKLHKTIIFITHDLDEALRLGDKIAILKDGEIVQQGKPDEILLYPANDYVEAFVKDVNRARALKVETVMKPPVWRIAADTIGDALAQIKELKSDYGYYVNEQGYQGIVTQESLEAIDESDRSKALTQAYCEIVPSLSPDVPLESVILDSIGSNYSLPVVDEQGNLKGSLERNTLIEIFAADPLSTNRRN